METNSIHYVGLSNYTVDLYMRTDYHLFLQDHKPLEFLLRYIEATTIYIALCCEPFFFIE